MSEEGFEFQIRVGQQKDAADVLQLWKDAGTQTSATDDEDAIRTRAAREDGLFLIAESGGRMIGTAIGGWDGWRGNVYRLAVLPEFRRKGVARALVESVETEMRRHGVRRVRILVVRPELAQEAMEFWKDAGYGQTDNTLPFAKDLADKPEAT